MKDKNNRTALYIASKFNYTDIVRLLLQRGANVDIKDKENRTALYIASKFKHIEIVNLLLQSGANVNIKDKDNQTALYIASSYGHIGVVGALLEHGADTEIKNKYGESPLKAASSKGHKNIENVLLKHGAMDDTLSQKLLRVCDHIDKVDLEELQRLLRAGADINIKDIYYDGRTCLMHSVKRKQFEATQMLLENGADTEIKDNNGDSPLNMASFEGYTKIEKLLLKHGATPLDRDERQKVLNKKLHSVCRADPGELKRLVSAGADINTRDKDGYTCLMLSLFSEDGQATTQLLLNKTVCEM